MNKNFLRFLVDNAYRIFALVVIGAVILFFVAPQYLYKYVRILGVISLAFVAVKSIKTGDRIYARGYWVFAVIVMIIMILIISTGVFGALSLGFKALQQP